MHINGMLVYALYFRIASLQRDLAILQTDSFTAVLNIISVFLYLVSSERPADRETFKRSNYSFVPRRLDD